MKTAACKKLLALLLCLVMSLGTLPAMAEGAPEQIIVPVITDNVPYAEMLPDNAELYEGYLYREVCDPFHGGVSFFSVLAREELSAPEVHVYDGIKPLIEKVAAGTLTNAQFVIPVEDLPAGYQSYFTFEELGITKLSEGGYLTPEATEALFNAVYGDFNLVLEALLHDCPYDFYWFDKTSKGGGGLTRTFNFKNVYSDSVEIGALVINFTVADEYALGGSQYDTDPAKTGLANTAAGNANTVAGKATSSMTDEEILTLFRDEICDLVEYNDAAADDSYTGDYGNPWQLVYVFDGDPTTNVVCEGYSKAFQHLCDLTSFDDAICYTVTGEMDGGTGAGGHMWNIVTLNGVNYLVDITNSDEGSAGEDGGLFLALPESGDWETGYTFVTPYGQEVFFAYDDDTKALWGEEVLKLGPVAGDEYTVTFDANGGEGSMADQTFTHGTAQALTENAFTKEGHTFSGWNTAADGSGTSYSDKQSITLTGDLELFAQWTADEYTVSFDANGGEGSMADQTFTHGTAQTLTENVFTREGYTFSGWNTAADGSGTAYTDKQSLTLTGDLELFAQWTPDEYTVTFDANGGEGSMADQAFTHGTAQALTENAFTREGYTFSGWNTAADGSGTAYTDKQSLTLTGDLELFAQWTPDEYTVTFDANGGEGSMADQTFTHGTAQALTENAFTNEGYTFSGWNTAADGSGTAYTDKQSLTLTGDLELFAQWTADSDIAYTIEYYEMDTDGQYPATATRSVPGTGTTGTAVTADTTASEGFTFDSANPSNVTEGTVAADGSLVLKVYLSRNKYSLTFDANGGEGGTSVDAYYGVAITEPTVTYAGHTFTGWDKTVPSIMPAEALTFTAQWDEITYTVTVTDGSGSGEYAEGEAVTITADTPVSGKQFAGWTGLDGLTLTSGDASSETVTFTMPAKAVEVAATYEDIPVPTYTVTVTDGSGSGDYAEGEAVTITADTPVTGKQFAGWTGLDGLTLTSGDASSETVTFTMPAKAVEVTATYEDIPVPTYTVTVTDGSGSGDYAEGEAVTITADTPVSGKQFAGWTGLDGLTLTSGDASSETVTFTMPAKAVDVVATYEDIPVPTYTVTVTDGSGSGEYAEGEAVTITADTPVSGKQFAGWTGLDGLTLTSGDASSETVTFTMPAKAVEVAATYEDIPVPTYTVTVTDGSGSGEYAEGEAVTITADTPVTGKQFASWTGLDGLTLTSGDASSETVTFTMPAKAVEVAATYEDIPVPTYTVTVTDGSGSGEYAEGETVTITADTPVSGKQFAGWTGLDGLTLTSGDASSETVTFTMPAKAVDVVATYEDIPVPTYTVTVNNGTGSGEYAEGEPVTITAIAPAAVKQFVGWTGLDGLTLISGDASSETVTFTMPPRAVEVTANYEDVPVEPIDPVLPSITSPTGPMEITVPEGDKGSMSITAMNADSFQWYINRNDGAGYVAIEGATSAAYTTSEVKKANDGYTYYCVATNADGSATSPVFTLKVLTQEPAPVPVTGDSSPIGMWMLMMCAAAVMMFVLLKRKPCGN